MTECPICGDDTDLMIEGDTDAIVESDLRRVCVEAASGCVFVHRSNDSDGGVFNSGALGPPPAPDTDIEPGAGVPRQDQLPGPSPQQRRERWEDRKEEDGDPRE